MHTKPYCGPHEEGLHSENSCFGYNFLLLKQSTKTRENTSAYTDSVSILFDSVAVQPKVVVGDHSSGFSKLLRHNHAKRNRSNK